MRRSTSLRLVAAASRTPLPNASPTGPRSEISALSRDFCSGGREGCLSKGGAASSASWAPAAGDGQQTPSCSAGQSAPAGIPPRLGSGPRRSSTRARRENWATSGARATPSSSATARTTVRSPYRPTPSSARGPAVRAEDLVVPPLPDASRRRRPQSSAAKISQNGARLADRDVGRPQAARQRRRFEQRRLAPAARARLEGCGFFQRAGATTEPATPGLLPEGAEPATPSAPRPTTTRAALRAERKARAAAAARDARVHSPRTTPWDLFAAPTTPSRFQSATPSAGYPTARSGTPSTGRRARTPSTGGRARASAARICLLMNRGDAAAALLIFHGDESRRRRGRDVDTPRR